MVLEWLTDFLTGPIMESRKAARSEAVASPPWGEHYSHFDMCRLEKLWKTRIRTAALPCLQSIASGNSKTWDFDIFLKHDVPVFYNRKRCLDAHFFRRSWPFLTKFQMIISKVFRIKVGQNSLIWWRILGTSLVAIVIECRRGGAIYLFTYRWSTCSYQISYKVEKQ